MGIKTEKLWDLTNRPSTLTKLEIFRKLFDTWLTIWNKQKWIDKELYVIDLFAGRGKYENNSYGSPLIFLDVISEKLRRNKLNQSLKLKLFFVEKDPKIFQLLKENINSFPFLDEVKKIAEIRLYQNDCNIAIADIIKEMKNEEKNPVYILIDPTGLQIKRKTMDLIVNLKNKKDILFNYILEGIRRTSGVARKFLINQDLTYREIKTIQTLQEFLGDDVGIIGNDIELLKNFVQSVFSDKGLNIIGFDIKYPDRDDTLYYLLYASEKSNIIEIVKDIYARQKEKLKGTTLFGGRNYYKSTLFELSSQRITKKSLLYQTKVEYGDWTINHVVGCMHGCKYPCYAMMMAKKFGWVKNYQEWRKPKIVINAMELLEQEIEKYKNKIKFVHLSFMTDPFMFNFEKQEIIPEIKELTLKIIERLNKEKIKVTTLTKGIYPEELLNESIFSRRNEYGITLVSLSNDFKNKFEPYSSPIRDRIDSLKKLSNHGLSTWVSIEPYPTSYLDKTANRIENLLEEIKFVKKIVFGKLNYRKLIETHNVENGWNNYKDFYRDIVKRLIEFCSDHGIEYFIKKGTPFSEKQPIILF